MPTDRGDDQDEPREAPARIQRDHASTRGATICSEDWSLVGDATQPGNIFTSRSDDMAASSFGNSTGPVACMADSIGTGTRFKNDENLRKVVSQLRHHHHQALTLRENARMIRDSLDSTRNAIADSRARTVELTGELMNDIETARLEDLREQLRIEHASRDEHHSKISLIELELHNTESKLASTDRKSSKLSSRILHFLDAYRGIESFPEVEAGSELWSEDSLPASPVMAPILAQYYSYAADAEIMVDRLRLLDFDYQEDLAVRGFRQDHDEVLSLPDEDFERAYEIQFAQARKDYDQSIENLEGAKQACLNQGLVIDDPEGEDLLSTEVTPVEPIPQITDRSPSILALDSQLPRNRSHLMLSEIHSSPTMLSTVTGHMASEVLPVQTSRAEKARNQAAVERWIVATVGDAEDPAMLSTHDREGNVEAVQVPHLPQPDTTTAEPSTSVDSQHNHDNAVVNMLATTAPPSAQEHKSTSSLKVLEPATRSRALFSLPVFVPERRHTAASPELSIDPRMVHSEVAPRSAKGSASVFARRLSDSAISQKSPKSRHDSGQGLALNVTSISNTDSQHLAP